MNSMFNKYYSGMNQAGFPKASTTGGAQTSWMDSVGKALYSLNQMKTYPMNIPGLDRYGPKGTVGTPTNFVQNQVAPNGVPYSSQVQNQAALSDATSMFSNLPQVQGQVPLTHNNLWNPESNTSGYQTLTSPNASVTGSPLVDNSPLPQEMYKGFETPNVTSAGNNFNATGNQYGNFLQDPRNNSLNFNPTQNAGAGDGLSGLFGLTDWANGGTPQYNTVNGTQVANKNYMSSGDILGGVGGALSMGMGAYGMFTQLDQGQQQLDDTSRRTDLLESKYNEELRHRGAIRAQNLAASNA